MPDWEQQIRDTYENAEDIIRILKSKGDNISLADLSINDSPKQQEQIKSVNNQGTFDSENPNIYFQKDDKNIFNVVKDIFEIFI